MPDKNYNIHHTVYYWSLVLLAISLPLSKFIMSVAQIILLGNWILEGDFYNKFKLLIKRKSLLFVISIYVIHMIGLLYSEDYNFGLHDIRIKLPLIVLPVIIGTSHGISNLKIKVLFQFFISAVIVSSLISTYILLGFTKITLTDFRDISIFISHIRFALLVNVAIFSSGYFLIFDKIKKTRYENIIYLCSIIWLIIFLYLLQSLTGIIIFFITGFVFMLYWIWKLRYPVVRTILILIMIGFPVLLIIFLARSVSRFYSLEDIDPVSIDHNTKNGNPYWHDFENKQIENGNYVWLYVSEKELNEEWNKKSDYNYYGKDNLGQEIKYTLIRYLTSKGYRKDAEGISKLTGEDIVLIESGVANHIFKDKYKLYPKLYPIIWQFDIFLKGGNPSGHSVTQRLIYLSTGFQIIM